MSRVSLCTTIITTGNEFASALATVGGSASAGRRRITRDTRSRTSLAAASRSADKPNSTVMELPPSRLTDVSDRMPSTPLTDSSMRSVICDSITSALAPG